MSSSVFTWPDRAAVDQAVRAWAAGEARRHPELLCLGYFGSYARGDWGVGSDLDLIGVWDTPLDYVARTVELYRRLQPRVAVDLLVYTPGELVRMADRPMIRRALAEGVVL